MSENKERLLDCDYFENKHTSRRRFKIKRIWKKEDEVIRRLDAIYDKLGIDYSELPEEQEYVMQDGKLMRKEDARKIENKKWIKY